ncbi:flavodoxin family protein [Nocardia sp. CDC159]|uniref:Flavodoxin family protein n=1 Tax=Nocardia pulmonis TaxID=2951408 RepID=A0A9X2E4M4_9NOCA|nr:MULTISPECIES: flavodoxin family protein [Nocardia]MCM6773540.1 flavodoxin family protein [Nocardia pulmonis]MCM6786427.1 flavodoxin family protein [Nocardia sp. CDC159]
MRAVIVCVSVSHGNTRRVAEVMGQVLGAAVVEPEQIDPADLATYDLVGFGSGVFNMNLHPRLRRFVRSLPEGQRHKAFVFTSSGFPEPPFRRYLRAFARLVGSKGFEVVGSFSCRGLDTWAPFKPFGGVKKGRPDVADFAAAQRFAEGLRARLTATA